MNEQKWTLRTEFSNDDIKHALKYNPQVNILYDNIAGLIAEVCGHNDEDNWYWLGQLKDGSFFSAIGGCDYTGWDCQSSVTSWVANTLEECLRLMLENDFGGLHEQKMKNLCEQVRGEQPFGLEIIEP